jgi:hypothetical protein
LPSPGKVLCRVLRPPLSVAACVLSSKTSPAADPFLQGRSKKEQLVVTASIGMKFRQEHPPHMPILEKCWSISVPCLSHEIKPPPSFSFILCLITTPCKACYRASATLRRTSAVPPPYVASRSTSRGYPADAAKGPTRRSARRMSRGIGDRMLLYSIFALSATQEIDGFSATLIYDVEATLLSASS